MAKFESRDKRAVDMAVVVYRPSTGEHWSVVAEADLERHGWAQDPLAAIESYRAEMDIPSGVDIQVKTDEESGYPVHGFRLKADFGVRTTRSQKALRLLGQYLIDLANGSESDDGFYGRGIELIEEN